MTKSASSPHPRIAKIRALGANFRSWLRWHLPVSHRTACEIAERQAEASCDIVHRDIRAALICLGLLPADPETPEIPEPAVAAERRHGLRAV